MKINYQSFLKVLCLTFLVLQSFGGFAQKTLATHDIVLIPSINQSLASVAWHPGYGRYYSSASGIYSTAFFVYDSLGTCLSATSSSYSNRGIWYNPTNGRIEGNDNQSRYLYYPLDNAGTQVGDVILYPGYGAPDAHSGGVLNTSNGEILFYAGSNHFCRYSSDGTPLGIVPIIIPAGSNFNITHMIYKGEPGREIGFFDYTNKRVYMYSISGGAYTYYYNLPSSAPNPSFGGFAYANGRFFLSNMGRWNGFPLVSPTIITSGSFSPFAACPGTASVPQSFIVSGSNITGDLRITVPVGFEVSRAADAGYTRNVYISSGNRTVPPTTVFVRIAASATGNLSGNMTITATGAETVSIALSGSSSNPGAVTVSGGGDFCDNAILTATGGSDGTIYWQNTVSEGTSMAVPATSQTVSNSGTYYFRAVNSAGCWGTQGSAEVYVTPLPDAPSPVSAMPDSICQGQSTQLSATSTGNLIKWYTVPSGGTALGQSSSAANFIVSPTGNTTYYAEAQTPNKNLLGDININSNSVGVWTLGYDFTPFTNLTVTGFRRYFGNKISIWTNTGTLVYTQNVTGENGTWTNNPLVTPVTLTAGTTYRIAVYVENDYYYFNHATYTYPIEVDNGIIGLSYEIMGDAFPITHYDNRITWFVDLTFAGTTCTSATRSEIAVNIFTPPTDGGTIDADQSVCMGETPELITSAELPAGTDGTIEYMWQASTVGETAGFVNLSNSNSSSYQPSALNVTTWYRRLAKLDCINGWTGAVASNVVEIAVYPEFNSGSITGSSEEFCGSGDPSIIESSEAATGGDGVIAYKWTANNVLIPDATGASYDPPAGVTETTTYRRYAGDGSCTSELISEGAYTVTIHPLPVVSISVTEDSNISDDAVLCYGTSATLQATAEEGEVPGGPKSRGAIASWVWDNAATLSDPLISNPVASPETGTTVYTVTYTDINGCNDSESVSITVLPEFTAGAIVNTETNLCYGVIPTQIGSITNAAGGDDNVTYRWDANGLEIIGADQAFYTPTEGITETTVFTRRAKDGACNDFEQSAGSYTVIVEPTPVTGIITKMPDVTNICEDGFISAYLTAGSGGNGVDELEFRVIMRGAGSWTSWQPYTSNVAISTTGLSGVEIRTRRMADYCENSDYSTVSWNIEPTSVAGVLTRIPDLGNVCENDVVSAVLTSGAGGNGTDELEYRTHNAEGWSAWTTYTSNAAISTTGLSGVEIRTRRIADYCGYSDYSTVSWSIEATPFAGILHKMPDINNICENEFISAYLTAGTGGNGIDELEYRTKAGGSGSGVWSAWATYTPNAAISTTGLSGVEIRTRRMADYCENSDYSTISWTIEASPVTGVLTRIPDMSNVCENDVVSAILSSGTGGNGIDELEYRTYSAYGPGSWSAWAVYISGNEISTNGLSGVEIRTHRMADFCQNASYNTVSWSIEATAWTGSLTKAPDVMNVCEGEIVSATVTPGFGGNGIDESEYRTYTPDGSDSGNWSDWTVYSSGEALTTIGITSIEIRTHRTATYCPSSPYTTVSWNIEQTPVAGTLIMTPDIMNLCEGESVSALLTPGEGGNGVDELEYRTYAAGSWSAWAAYTSGNEISTGGISGVEIRTRRLATYCVNTDYMTVNWSIEPVAVAGMLIRIPDADVLCMGSPVSAAFIPGNGGNGIDNVEFRSQASGNWSEWTNYVSGDAISTEGLSAIEIRTWREADWCGDSEVVTVGWAIDAPTEAGTITGGGQVCYGENSAVLTNTGYTGEILMWQSSVNNWQTVVDIMNTSSELTIQNLIQTTQYRTIVANGTCGQAYSAAETVTIVHLPAPYINGPEELCGNETATYETASGAINYQWNVTNATIISGQGTSQITVIWDTPGSQEISVTYENVLGCTLENPFELQVQVNETPEKPEISVDWLNLILTSSAATGNQWFQDGTPISGATNLTLTVTENGNYTVMTTSVSGCASEVSDAVSIMNVDVARVDDVALSIYPNPTSGIITIDLNGPKVESYSLRIFDDMGREVVYEDFGRVSSVKKVIDLSDGYSGLYTVLIKCGDGFIVRKVILVKD